LGNKASVYGGGTLDGMDMILEFETGGVVAVGSKEPGSGLTVGVDMMSVLWRSSSGV
jgi:hypothetical protein